MRYLESQIHRDKYRMVIYTVVQELQAERNGGVFNGYRVSVGEDDKY
jgi:hypothetical protein